MFSVLWATDRDDAERVLRGARRHPKRLSRLREWYRAEHDVLDALWWRVHPGETSPAGVEDPACRRERLQRDVYSFHGTDHDGTHDGAGDGADDPARLELIRVEAELGADARALDRAVRKYLAAYPPRDRPTAPDGGQDAGQDAGQNDGQNDGQDAGHELGGDVSSGIRSDDREASRRRMPVSTIVASVLVIVSLVVSGTLWWRLQQLIAHEESLAAAADPVGAWLLDNSSTLRALQVFERPQTLDDVYPLVLPAEYDMRSVRQLGEPEPGAAYRLFGALADPDQVCLVIVFSDLSSTSSCASETDFRDDGLTVATHARRVTGDSHSEYVTNELTWLPNGRLASRGRVSTGDS